MSFLGVKQLNALQQKKNIITPFNSKRVKNGAYELSLGGEVYLTDSKDGKVEYLSPENRQVDINPGQFALLLTKETVNIPNDKIAFISIKASEKLKGLVNVSGFHVDPGYHDNLLFSVYNAGPSCIVLNLDEPYFPIWFADLNEELTEEEAYNNNNVHFKKMDHINPKYIESLKRGELTSPKAIVDKIKEGENQVNEKFIRLEEKTDRNDWLLKILIGIVFAICLKLIWDWSAFDRGFEQGKKSEKFINEIQSEVLKTLPDSVVVYKIDSILAERNGTKKAK
ncbi:hypothetical protein ACFOWA_19625 [Pedobacter lithocola]|uniref:Deoxycytidine triphosphate deaminase n=1 Tax=Pedobacter lithocola TaxID=1908239 RepID=A0ABV8PGV9_9SPHI